MKNTHNIDTWFQGELRPSPKLSPEQIKELQELYKTKLDTILSEQDALDSWIALLNFMKAISRLPKK